MISHLKGMWYTSRFFSCLFFACFCLMVIVFYMTAMFSSSNDISSNKNPLLSKKKEHQQTNDVINEELAHINGVRHVFFDVGSNDGQFLEDFFRQGTPPNANTLTGYAARSGTFAWELHVFEPNPKFNPILVKKASRINQQHAIKIYNNTAAWTYNGEIKFYLDKSAPDAAVGSSLFKEHRDVVDKKGQSEVIVAKCVDLAALIGQYSLEDEVIVRLDVEGAEYDLILHLAATNTLRLVDKISVEYHPYVQVYKSVDDVLNALMHKYFKIAPIGD